LKRSGVNIESDDNSGIDSSGDSNGDSGSDSGAYKSGSAIKQRPRAPLLQLRAYQRPALSSLGSLGSLGSIGTQHAKTGTGKSAQVRPPVQQFDKIEDSDLDGDATSRSGRGSGGNVSESRVRGAESSGSGSDNEVKSSGSGNSDTESSEIESDDGSDDTDSIGDGFLSDDLSEEAEGEVTKDERESVERDDLSNNSDDDAFGAIQDRFHMRVSKDANAKVSSVKPKFAVKTKGGKVAGMKVSKDFGNGVKTAGLKVSGMKASQVTKPKAPSKQRASVKPRGHIEAKELNVAYPCPQLPSSPVLLTSSSSVREVSIPAAASERVSRDSSPRLLLLCSSPSSSLSHDKLTASSTPRSQASFGSEDPSTLRLSWAACQTLTSEQARAETTKMPYGQYTNTKNMFTHNDSNTTLA
jgi:hypothetical protein